MSDSVRSSVEERVDNHGNTGTVKVQRIDSSCTDCPKDGKKGYHFASGHSEQRREREGP